MSVVRGVTTALALALALALAMAGGCADPPKLFEAPMTLGGVEVSAPTLNAGSRTYRMRCASCHGKDGSGQGPGTSSLKESPRDFRTAEFKYTSTEDGALPTDADLAAVIRDGRVENGMPAWPGMPDEDLNAVVQYIKTFSPRWAQSTAANVAASDVAKGS